MTEPESNLRTISTVSYVLHLIVAVGALIPGGQLGPVLLIVALVLDLVNRSEAHGSWLESHFSFRIKTVAWVGILYLLTAPLWFLLVLPGWIAWGIISIWFLYRIVKGMVRMKDQRPMDL